MIAEMAYHRRRSGRGKLGQSDQIGVQETGTNESHPLCQFVPGKDLRALDARFAKEGEALSFWKLDVLQQQMVKFVGDGS
jgi:hypothetical protein